MIKVVKNTATEIAVTFKEKSTVANPFYLIQVQNTQDEIVSTITPTDISTSKDRYNLFSITSPLAKGEYYYTAYDSDIEDPTIGDVIGVVEYGIFVVDSTEDLEDNIYL